MAVPISPPETVVIPPSRRGEHLHPREGCSPGTVTPRDSVNPTRRKHCRTVGNTLSIASAYQRRLIRAAYRALGGTFTRLNDHRRALLSEAIFQIENDLEHRQAKHEQVAILRTIRNRLYDDLGWNESRPANSAHERTHAA